MSAWRARSGKLSDLPVDSSGVCDAANGVCVPRIALVIWKAWCPSSASSFLRAVHHSSFRPFQVGRPVHHGRPRRWTEAGADCLAGGCLPSRCPKAEPADAISDSAKITETSAFIGSDLHAVSTQNACNGCPFPGFKIACCSVEPRPPAGSRRGVGAVSANWDAGVRE